MNKHISIGIGCGVVATVSMSAVHFAARWVGVFPEWKPVPLAVTLKIFSGVVPQPLILPVAVIIHLTYGGFWAGVLWTMTRRVTIWKGVGMGAFLWLVMQLAIFPFLGWGVFGMRLAASIVPNVLPIPAAAFAEHMVYGSVLGWLGSRSAAPATS